MSEPQDAAPSGEPDAETLSPLRRAILSISPEEIRIYEEKKQRVAAHLKERFSCVPFHQERAALEGDAYWYDLAGSCINLLDD